MLADSEEILVEKAKAGDLRSFELLVSGNQKKIFAFIYRMVLSQEDAIDLTQEVFIQLFCSLDKFRGEAKFSTWLYRIASNKSLDFLRRNRKKKIINEANIEATGFERLYSIEQSPENKFLHEEKIRLVRRVIAGLPDKYRIVIILFHYENFSYRQIANTLGVPEKTVATRIYRAKLILKECLGGDIDGASYLQ